ncbi:MAG: DUF429 domain-containing protein [Chloroflexi bacterium]|nr:DUF429 domain-containing protein [Chloroflexota bacterium]MCC6891562.1 DUF429 domain-containing protein [Anaerolineae bacterium]
MLILGLDFTSAPTRAKPITCAEAYLESETLHVEAVHRLSTFTQFEQTLVHYPVYVAGFDFPFSQPRRLIETLGWPTEWAELIALIAAMGKNAFEAEIRLYSDPRPSGDKLHRRVADVRANAISPMKLDFVPVGKMFFQGAPRLLAAGLNVLPCHPTASPRAALEVYPALVNRRFNQRASYKQDAVARQTDQHTAARSALLDVLMSPVLRATYGIKLKLAAAVQRAAVEDKTGDTLDAVLCAIQAAWASRTPDYGIPPDVDALEGWIADPSLV